LFFKGTIPATEQIITAFAESRINPPVPEELKNSSRKNNQQDQAFFAFRVRINFHPAHPAKASAPCFLIERKAGAKRHLGIDKDFCFFSSEKKEAPPARRKEVTRY